MIFIAALYFFSFFFCVCEVFIRFFNMAFVILCFLYGISFNICVSFDGVDDAHDVVVVVSCQLSGFVIK